MKHCIKCGVEKELSEYYGHKKMSDGHLGKCKECCKKDNALRIAEKSKDPQWLIKEAERCRLKTLRYKDKYKPSQSKKRESIRQYRKSHPEKYFAHREVRKAVKCGFLKPAPCMFCGEEKTESHHEDYRFPLAVVWLCKRHHMERHVEINNQKRIEKAKQNVLT